MPPAMCRIGAIERGIGLVAAFAHRGGKTVQYVNRIRPINTLISDRLAIGQRFRIITEFLGSGDEVGFDHACGDTARALFDLLGDGIDHHGLVAIVLE